MADVQVRSELSAVVWKLEAGPGDKVGAGSVLLILESMKMEIPVEAPVGGTVRSVAVAAGEMVTEGQVLATIST